MNETTVTPSASTEFEEDLYRETWQSRMREVRSNYSVHMFNDEKHSYNLEVYFYTFPIYFSVQ